MTGKVVFRVPQTGALPHRCDIPVGTAYSNGTIWQCDCGRLYEVTNMDAWVNCSRRRLRKLIRLNGVASQGEP